MRYFFVIIFFGLQLKLSAQVTANFNLPTEVCLEEQFQLENTSTDATNYEWSLCDFPVEQDNDSIRNINNSDNGRSFAFTIAEDTSVLVFFASGSLRKASFTDRIDNSDVTLEAISGSSGSFSSPNGIRVIKEGNEWIGFTANKNGTDGVSRLFFGKEIGTSLSSYDFIGGATALTNTASVSIINSTTEKVLLAGGNAGNELDVVLFENGFTNDATAQYNYPITGLTKLSGLTKRYSNNEWTLFAASDNDDKIFQIKFENGYNNPPTVEELNITGYSYENPYKIKFVENRGNPYLFVLNYEGNIDVLKQESGEWNYLRTVNSTSSNLVTITSRLENGNPYLFGTSIDLSTAGIYRVSIECPVTTEINPTTSYSTAGTYPITLVAYDSDGNSDLLTKDIVVTSDVAPTGAINLDLSYCIADNITFSLSTSADISTYNWNFGDGNSSTAAAPSHQYASVGEYYISLGVKSVAGCINTFYDTLKILAEPTVDFTTTQTEYCSFEAINFTNTTTPTDYGENVTWSWDFNGEGSSSDENPSFAFETLGTKTITLEANVLGCIDTYQANLEIINGPAVDFGFDSNCLGEIIQFNNLSTGANVTGYLWDFGNGETSTAEDPQNTYSNAGTYPVSLTVSNSNGCDNTVTKNISIFEQVVDSIMATDAIENLPFEVGVDWNNTFDSIQNISYLWEIAGAVQTRDTASYTLAEGQYTVQLEIATSLGCVFSAERTIDVLPSEQPTPDFNLPTEVCLEEQFQVENTSINTDSYEWSVCAFPVENGNDSIKNINSSDNGRSFALTMAEDTSVLVFFASGSLRKGSFNDKIDYSDVTLEVISGSSGSFSSPNGIRVIKEGGEWIGFTANTSGSDGVSRLFFGNEIGTSLSSFDFIEGATALTSTASVYVIN